MNRGFGLRWWGWLALAPVFLAACSGEAGPGASAPDSRQTEESVSVTQLPASPEEKVPSGVENPAGKELPTPLVDVDRLISGGPPPDGIPSISDPKFDRARDVDFLEPDEPVLAVSIGGVERAYPAQILIWHEIVNDTFGDVPVVVTYCPLCNSALAFDRRAAGRVLSFGVSGRLYNSDLVMFDRQTESLWPQIQARAVAGVLTGTRLTAFPVQTVPWKEWRRANPEGLVLNRDTGYNRPYGQNPYIAYDNPGTDPFLLDVDADDRLPAKQRVLGLGTGAQAVAITADTLLREGTREVQVGGDPVALFARRGLASALDRASIAAGRDVGTTGAFSPVVQGRHLTFQRHGARFVDEQTGTSWSILGLAEAGPLRGQRLRAVEHVDTFWFAWSLFQPQTELIR